MNHYRLLSLVFVLLVFCSCSDDPANPAPKVELDLGHGVIAINCEPDSCAGPWSLVGPDSTLSGISDVTLTEMKPGLYEITWGDVPGWHNPNPATFSLEVVADSTTTFVSTYSVVQVVNEVAAFPRLKTTASGEQTQFNTFITDQLGNEMVDVPTAWHSSDTQVATIDSSGTVTGVAPGRVEIMASVGEISSESVDLVVAENWFGAGLCDETGLPCTTFNPRISLGEEFSEYWSVAVDVDADGTTDCFVAGSYIYGNNIDAHTSVTPVGGAWVAVNTAYSAIADSIRATVNPPFDWENFSTWAERIVLGTTIDENLEWVQERATVDYHLKTNDDGIGLVSYGVPVETRPYFVAIRLGEPPAVTFGWIELWGGSVYGCSGVGMPRQ